MTTVLRDGAGQTLTKWDYGYGLYGTGPYGGPTPFASHLTSLRTAHTILHHRLVVTVNGVPTIATQADATHSHRRYTGIASFTVPLPLESHLYDPATERILHQPVVIKAGHDETQISTIFSGRITDDSGTVSDRGRWLTIRAAGWSTLLDKEQLTDLVYPGGTALDDIFRSLCALVGVPAYRADDFTAPDATAITLGGNPDVDGGSIVIPTSQRPLAWLNRKAGLYGYAVFDVPDGAVVFKRISGSPVGDVVASYTEGVDPFEMERTRTLDGLANYIEVTGATGTDSDGVPFEITSIADEVPSSDLLDGGYRFESIRDTDIVTQAQADVVRNVAEIDQGSPTTEHRWRVVGDSTLSIGDVVAIDWPTMHASGSQWLTDIRQQVDDRGYGATLTGWTGGGEALPAGSDAVTIDVQTDPLHIGDEYVAWYAVPQATRRSVAVTFTVPDDYTAIAYEAYVHGCNSFMIGGTNADSTVSRIVVTQNGEEVGDDELPVLDENYASQLPYGADAFPITAEDGSTITNPLYYWKRIRGSIPGNLEPGTATVTFTSGEDSRLPSSTKWDDWEIQQFKIVLSGVGRPALPGDTP